MVNTTLLLVFLIAWKAKEFEIKSMSNAILII